MAYASALQDFSMSVFGSGFKQMSFPTFRKALAHIHDHFIPHERNDYHPHIFSHRFLGLLSFLLIAVKVSMIASLAMSPAVTYSSAITAENVVSLTNSSRSEFEISPLKLSTKLSLAAQNKANDMAEKGYFAHNTPDGKTPWSFIQGVGYHYLSAGENLAVDFTQAEAMDVAWMNSPGHRANILNKSFQEIGIGIASGEFQGHKTTFVVQMFGAPVVQQVALQDKPTSVQASSPAPASTAPTQVASASKATSPATPVTVPEQVAIATEPAPTDLTLGTQPPVVIVDTALDIRADQLDMTVITSGPASRVIATFNKSAVMFDPTGENTWQAQIPWSALQSESSLNVIASDMSGNAARSELSSFSPSLQKNYQFLGEVKGAAVNFFGTIVDVENFENNFYLLIVTTILVCLIMAILIHRHIQHIALVANGSFVVILAMFLWMAG
jgi:hypothetical protein